MKPRSTQRLLAIAALLFAFSFSLAAQDLFPTRIVIVQKTVNEDGTTTVIKKSIYSEERDPCQVFIGVMISGLGKDGKGAFVSGVIPGTAAQTAGLRPGDVILALDDAETDSHEALLLERNKHKPGEWFTLTILRQGEVVDVDAQFQSCPNDPTTQEPNYQKNPDPVPEEQFPDDPKASTRDGLSLLDYSIFPNPTYDELNLSFRAEAKPASVRIAEPGGRVIFEENLPNFDGYYARQLDLQNATPGILLLTIQQEGRLVTKKIVLLARV